MSLRWLSPLYTTQKGLHRQMIPQMHFNVQTMVPWSVHHSATVAFFVKWG